MPDNYWERLRSQRIGRRSMLRAAARAGVGAAGLALVGCGDDDDDSAPAAAQTQTEQPDAQAAQAAAQAEPQAQAAQAQAVAETDAGEPKRGGTLRINVGPLVAVQDPHEATQPNVLAVWHNVSHHLVELDPETWELTPDGAAESWELPDDLTMVFHLHPNAKFQDVPPANGRKFTAEDVVFSLDRIRTDDPRYARRAQFEKLDTMQAVDPETVQMTLAEPYVPVLTYLGSMYNMLVSPEAVEQYGDLKAPESNIGIGPFRLTRFDKEAGFTLEADPGYWREDLPYLATVEGFALADAATAQSALRAGELDFLDLSANFRADIEASNPEIIWETELLGGLLYEFGMNHAEEPFGDPRVRQAIHLTIDRELMVQAKYQGHGQPVAPVPDALSPYAIPMDELMQIPGYRQPKDEDYEAAKQLLDSAGFGAGFETRAKTADQYLPDIEPLLPIFESILGVKVNMEVLEWGAYKKAESEKDTVTFGTGYLVEPDPDATLRLLHHTDGSRNYVNYSSAQVDDLIEQQAREFDPELRAEITREASRLIIEDAAHGWHATGFFFKAIQPWVRGLPVARRNWLDRVDFRGVWLDT